MVNLGYPPDVMGGAETTLATLAHLLVGRGCQVSVLSLSSRGVDWGYDDAGVRVRFVAAHPMGNQMMNPRRNLPQKVMWQLLAECRGWSYRKVAEFITQEQPDVINSHNLLGLSLSTWEAARNLDIPLVHTLHGPSLLCPKGTMFRGDRPCSSQCGGCRLVTSRHRRSSVLPNAIIANSAFTLKAHTDAGYFPSARRYVIPNAPAPVTRTYLGRPGSAGARRGKVARIGYLGRLLRAKGVSLLMEALSRMPQDGWVAKIAGTGPVKYVGQIASLLNQRSSCVEFVGWISPDEFFSQIDVLVVPSLAPEPQGMGILEAIARQVPVIYADHGGLSELAGTVDGTMPFRAGSVDDLAKVLTDLVQKPEILEDLSRGATIDAYLAGYTDLFRGEADPAARQTMPGSTVMATAEPGAAS
jgi:glycosyltransferase involved in cell wall biosynthesis